MCQITKEDLNKNCFFIAVDHFKNSINFQIVTHLLSLGAVEVVVAKLYHLKKVKVRFIIQCRLDRRVRLLTVNVHFVCLPNVYLRRMTHA